MSNLRTSAQQALEAMEQLAVLAEYGTTGPGKCNSRALDQKQATSLRLAISNISRAQISTLRAALAEPVQKPLTETQVYAAIKGIDSLKAVEVARAVEKAHGIGESK